MIFELLVGFTLGRLWYKQGIGSKKEGIYLQLTQERDWLIFAPRRRKK